VGTPLSRIESALPPEHEERLLGIAHRTSFARSIVRPLDDWLDTLRAAWRSPSAEPQTR
jgi:hypothetical protein